jgi:CubicO group peptidase (beta-lactamase class C family)
MKHIFLFCTLLSLVFLLAGCIGGSPGLVQPPVEYWPTEGWRISTPEVQGMDSTQLANMLAEIGEQGYAIDSVSVVRNGHLVLDAYVHPSEAGQKHKVYSCTKSIVSTLIGIAIEQGQIEGVDVPLLELFPGRLNDYILSAVRSNAPLAENAEGAALLQSYVNDLARP